jgi:anti-sigma regulatory factor (Ser/Thr protein kinase)
MTQLMTASDVRAARAHVRAVCAQHGIGNDRCDAAQLAVTELLGNALRHGRQPIDYDVVCDHGCLVMSVADGSPSPPRPRNVPAATAESGRGMLLLEAVARQWWCEPTPGGKRVWALV